MKSFIIIIFTLFTFVFYPPILAQKEQPVITHGTRVRVSASRYFHKEAVNVTQYTAKPQYVGIVVSIDSDTLVIAAEDWPKTLMVPVAYLQKLEISLGKKSYTGRNAAIGFGVGVVFGLTVGTVAAGGLGGCRLLEDEESDGCAEGIGIGFVGGILGAILGAKAGPEEVWAEVPLTQIHAEDDLK
ncbi:hypothetical protein GWO43_13830 [candidate division KSB1 bacterium]|nr:hypothetical protein [candidate division KSB1 bacterium]NIR72077.1 hypothetical protein [candidate division KSB1 bacterium]NIS25017.1 hypothetical protein [candidate division KSB1 bacterium]NIT71927.1 hypothetical protein [candidate division KSB1 bacterium]NIU25670.1 hypothetical protein [candidate division KSB1 bacterium]